jgi:hypothetical protein
MMRDVAIPVFAIAVSAFGFAALGQQMPDALKLAPVYQQQRNSEADGRAQCITIVVDLQARIADLEKQLAAAKQPDQKE